MPAPHVLIAGAGIGGLTAALALARRGIGMLELLQPLAQGGGGGVHAAIFASTGASRGTLAG